MQTHFDKNKYFYLASASILGFLFILNKFVGGIANKNEPVDIHQESESYKTNTKTPSYGETKNLDSLKLLIKNEEEIFVELCKKNEETHRKLRADYKIKEDQLRKNGRYSEDWEGIYETVNKDHTDSKMKQKEQARKIFDLLRTLLLEYQNQLTKSELENYFGKIIDLCAIIKNQNQFEEYFSAAHEKSIIPNTGSYDNLGYAIGFGYAGVDTDMLQQVRILEKEKLDSRKNYGKLSDKDLNIIKSLSTEGNAETGNASDLKSGEGLGLLFVKQMHIGMTSDKVKSLIESEVNLLPSKTQQLTVKGKEMLQIYYKNQSNVYFLFMRSVSNNDWVLVSVSIDGKHYLAATK
jgi:hypothetical protein